LFFLLENLKEFFWLSAEEEGKILEENLLYSGLSGTLKKRYLLPVDIRSEKLSQPTIMVDEFSVVFSSSKHLRINSQKPFRQIVSDI